jgi:phosphate transport system substrate-binding protein
MKNILFTKIFILAVFISTLSVNAQSKKDYIYISGTRFTYPLIEKWISEYKKERPGLTIKLQYKKQINDSVNLKVVAHTLGQNEIKDNEEYIKVSKYAILPITNDRNKAFRFEFRKGLKQEDFKNVFFTDANSIFEEDVKKQTNYTVYSRVNQGCLSVAFANHFGLTPNEFKGKKISGDDQFLTYAVQKDTIGVTYNNLGNIFDLTSRLPVKGIYILPIDINQNGRIDKEEQIYDNLDLLTQYLENNQNNKAIPTDFVSFIVNKDQKNENLSDFINWVLSEGQQYNHQFGFLNNNMSNVVTNTNISLVSEKN